MPDVGEHVAYVCSMPTPGGVILYAIYSEQDTPPIDDPDKKHVRFEDGTTIGTTANKLTIQCMGDIEITFRATSAWPTANIYLNE